MLAIGKLSYSTQRRVCIERSKYSNRAVSCSFNCSNRTFIPSLGNNLRKILHMPLYLIFLVTCMCKSGGPHYWYTLILEYVFITLCVQSITKFSQKKMAKTEVNSFCTCIATYIMLSNCHFL